MSGTPGTSSTATPQGVAGRPSQPLSSSDALYRGWMTGYAYQACRNLYFNTGLKNLDPVDKSTLLEWLQTYTNLAEEWNVRGQEDLIAGLQSMTANTLVLMKKEDSGAEAGAGLSGETFDIWFHGLSGAIRSTTPYAYDAAQFASTSSRLSHPFRGGGGDSTAPQNDLLDELRHSLATLRNDLPPGAFAVISNDIERMANWIGNGKERKYMQAPLSVPASSRKSHSLAWYVTRTWSDLILGTANATDALNRVGRAILHTSVIAVAFALFTSVGLVVLIPFYVLPTFGISISNVTLTGGTTLLSSLSTIITTLSAIGLSITLLARKAWSGVKAFEPWAAVQLAGWGRLRTDDDLWRHSMKVNASARRPTGATTAGPQPAPN